jgi:hypothetical protein
MACLICTGTSTSRYTASTWTVLASACVKCVVCVLEFVACCLLRQSDPVPFIHSFTHSINHSLTHSLTHLLTHPFTHPLAHPLTHSLTRSLTHSLTHSLIHSLTRVVVARRCVLDSWVFFLLFVCVSLVAWVVSLLLWSHTSVSVRASMGGWVMENTDGSAQRMCFGRSRYWYSTTKAQHHSTRTQVAVQARACVPLLELASTNNLFQPEHTTSIKVVFVQHKTHACMQRRVSESTASLCGIVHLQFVSHYVLVFNPYALMCMHTKSY